MKILNLNDLLQKILNLFQDKIRWAHLRTIKGFAVYRSSDEWVDGELLHKALSIQKEFYAFHYEDGTVIVHFPRTHTKKPDLWIAEFCSYYRIFTQEEFEKLCADHDIRPVYISQATIIRNSNHDLVPIFPFFKPII